MAAEHEKVAALASALAVLKPEPALLDSWLGAMRSGDFGFGVGLLRSGDDEYDPFGVLAAISLGEWAWDDQDEAWAIEGDAMSVPPARVAEWLGVDEPNRLAENHRLRHMESLIDTVTEAADSAVDFAGIVDLFDRAHKEIQRRNSKSDRGIDRFRSVLDSPLLPGDVYDYRDFDRVIGRRW